MRRPSPGQWLQVISVAHAAIRAVLYRAGIGEIAIAAFRRGTVDSADPPDPYDRGDD